jgi:NAD(P)-dependent dehydrogenase (short-subunit alcohol dehydrogenase family)
MNLDGKVVVVSGAASGLGLETCRALVEAGARVAGLDRDGERLLLLADELKGSVVTTVADVTDEASVKAGVGAALAAFGAVHVAVSCAGIGNAAKTVSRGAPFPLDVWNKVIAVNLTGTFNVIRLAAVAMVANAPDPDTGERGVIVNTASGAATQGQIGQAAYSASKAGIVGMTLPIARDLAEHGIRVVTISPGLFETPLVAGLPTQVAQGILDKSLVFPRRMGQAREFAMLVRHVVENTYFNATAISLDAGARMAAR